VKAATAPTGSGQSNYCRALSKSCVCGFWLHNNGETFHFALSSWLVLPTYLLRFLSRPDERAAGVRALAEARSAWLTTVDAPADGGDYASGKDVAAHYVLALHSFE